MRGAERVLATVRGWVEKAESDLQYLKALLAFRSIDFPKIHDIGELVALLQATNEVGISVEEQRRLTSYATVTRYPGDYEPVTLAEARRAVALARRVRRYVRAHLPKEALRRRKR